MAGGVIGEARVKVGADASGFVGDANSKLKGPMAKVGKTVGDAFALSFKAAASVAATGVAAVVSTALAKGFARTVGLDTARGRLKGIGIEGKQLEAVMMQVDKAVTDTTASMSDGAQAASLMMTSGVKGGKDLENALNAIVGLTEATGAGMDDITSIMQKVAADSGQMGMALSQLSTRGINGLAMLADYFNVTQEEASQMVRNGEIDFQQFASAIAEGTELMGSAMSGTFSGLWRNIMSNMGRVGEVVTTPLIEAAKIIMGPVLESLRALAKAAKPLQETFSSWLIPLAEDFAGAISKIDLSNLDFSKLNGPLQFFSNNLGGIATISAAALGPLLQQLPLIGKYFKGLTGPIGAVIGFFTAMVIESETLRSAFGTLFGALGELMPSFGLLGGAIAQLISSVAALAGDSLGTLIQVLVPVLVPAIESLVTALAAVVDWLSQAIQFITPIAPALAGMAGTAAGVIAAFQGWGAITTSIKAVNTAAAGSTTLLGFATRLKTSSAAAGPLGPLQIGRAHV